MTDVDNDEFAQKRRAAVRTAAILGTLVVVFYIGFILSHLL